MVAVGLFVNIFISIDFLFVSINLFYRKCYITALSQGQQIMGC